MSENRFIVGPTYCGFTFQLVNECEHCIELAKQPKPTGGTKVVAIDRQRGIVTLDRYDE